MADPSAFPYYPVHDFGPAMKGMVIGGLGIVHVFLAQFAIGGGMLLCYLEWLGQRRREPDARRFVDGMFRTLVLVSFVAGALTGVGMWFTSIQVSARTIGLMVNEFHWLWGIEWTFFALEITAGYLFYRYGSRLGDRARLRLLALYAIAAWFSLFWINGILSWQLTPGDWQPGATFTGFFNPSFWPSLLYRTAVATTIAGLVACVVVNGMSDLDRDARARLIHRFAHGMVPVAIMPVLGLWYLAVIPSDSRSWLLGGSAAMTMFTGLAAGASALIGAYALIGLVRRRLYINGATALLLVALAFGATAAGEFVREGARKPFSVRDTLYSNSITPGEVAALRRTGSVTDDPYPLLDADDYPTEQLRTGAKVIRLQCSVCHTMDGANGIDHLTGTWTTEQLRMNLAKLQRTRPFMPPFAGNAAELEAVVQLLLWRRDGRPDTWPGAEAVRATDGDVLARIQTWLDEVGTAPAAGRLAPPRGGSR